GFRWLPLLPPPLLQAVVVGMGVAALALAAGWWVRVSAGWVFLAWGYLYAVESTRTYWMSYYYLELLVVFLLVWMPSGARLGVRSGRRAGVAWTGQVPGWTVFLLRAQLVVAYFYAGWAKVNADWLLDAVPVRWFLTRPHVARRLDFFLGADGQAQARELLQGEFLAYLLSWAGAAFDLGVGFLLLARRTRVLGVVLMLVFHGTNHFLLFEDIEWFPLVGVLTATIFLEPDWPDRLGAWLGHPRLPSPDWRWALGGAVLLPVVGLALGWGARASRGRGGATVRPGGTEVASGSRSAGWWTAAGVAAWVGVQVLLPLRHLLIPGDHRLTLEGLSFSWRLKAEVYRVMPCEITVEDPGLVARDSAGRVRLDWSRWAGEPVLHRVLADERPDWSRLPELVVLRERVLGDRVVYNPQAIGAGARSDTAIRERIAALWQERYGRPPASVVRTVPPAEILDAYALALRRKGFPAQSRAEVFAAMTKLHGPGGDGQMMQFLRRCHPFTLDREGYPGSPVYAIEDPRLGSFQAGHRFALSRAAWPAGPATRCAWDAGRVDVGAVPLVVHELPAGAEEAPPPERARLVQKAGPEAGEVRVDWNYRGDAGRSKSMHLSSNPFLLQRYAVRVADLWEREQGRRPRVLAQTAVSLNGRALQAVVDPSVDLVTAPRRWFGRHAWVNDLEAPRLTRAEREAFGRP
ncbi:MAG: HTTM domain-containing protein, partial [Verrucomicrobiota bacterium]